MVCWHSCCRRWAPGGSRAIHRQPSSWQAVLSGVPVQDRWLQAICSTEGLTRQRVGWLCGGRQWPTARPLWPLPEQGPILVPKVSVAVCEDRELADTPVNGLNPFLLPPRGEPSRTTVLRLLLVGCHKLLALGCHNGPQVSHFVVARLILEADAHTASQQLLPNFALQCSLGVDVVPEKQPGKHLAYVCVAIDMRPHLHLVARIPLEVLTEVLFGGVDRQISDIQTPIIVFSIRPLRFRSAVVPVGGISSATACLGASRSPGTGGSKLMRTGPPCMSPIRLSGQVPVRRLWCSFRAFMRVPSAGMLISIILASFASTNVFVTCVLPWLLPVPLLFSLVQDPHTVPHVDPGDDWLFERWELLLGHPISPHLVPHPLLVLVLPVGSAAWAIALHMPKSPTTVALDGGTVILVVCPAPTLCTALKVTGSPRGRLEAAC
mmetsp:Transcript_39067/g.70016  ORF Transcript_39067/g.70016 Transcript_39067/m.70016 type:complete len:435 (+) Transcript_39067:871-2175(+)